MSKLPSYIQEKLDIVADTSPLAELAKAVCIVKGIDPTGDNPAGISNWQAAIATSLMMERLDKISSRLEVLIERD